MQCALLLLCSAALAQSPAIADISLHDTKTAVQSKLKVQATLQREEEGQQVWEFHAATIKNLIIGYDAENQVRYVTAVGNDVPCELLGTTPKTLGAPPDLTFLREAPGFMAIAHGASVSHLTSCSLKDPNSRMDDDDEKPSSR